MLKKKTADNVLHEWLVDRLAAPKTTGVIEGTDASSFDDKFEDLDRLGNRSQIFRNTFRVSATQEASQSSAPANIANAQIKAMKEQKRDVEATIVSDNDRVAGSGATAGLSRGLGDWLDSAGPSDVTSNYRTPAASISAQGVSITESQFNTVLESIHNQSGSVPRTYGVFDSSLRRAISEFHRAEGTTTATPYHVHQAADAKKITLSVSLYESDFGVVTFFTSNNKCSPVAGGALDRGYILDPNFLSVATLRPIYKKQLEDQGGGPRGFVECEKTLVMQNPLAHGKIT